MNPTNGKIALTFSSEVSSVSTLRSVRCETLPSVSVEELSVEFENRDQIQVLDARPKHYFSRTSEMVAGGATISNSLT